MTTKYLNGFVLKTSTAFICLGTPIKPNSVPIQPAQIKTIIIGLISLIMEILNIKSFQKKTSNFLSVGRDCNVKTKPIINPVTAINSRD